MQKALEAAATQPTVNEKAVSGRVRGLLKRIADLVGSTKGASSEDETLGMAEGSGSSQHPPISKRDTHDTGGGQGASL